MSSLFRGRLGSASDRSPPESAFPYYLKRIADISVFRGVLLPSISARKQPSFSMKYEAEKDSVSDQSVITSLLLSFLILAIRVKSRGLICTSPLI